MNDLIRRWRDEANAIDEKHRHEPRWFSNLTADEKAEWRIDQERATTLRRCIRELERLL